jgi:farnesyl-diphosphate farnesyltransferase
MARRHIAASLTPGKGLNPRSETKARRRSPGQIGLPSRGVLTFHSAVAEELLKNLLRDVSRSFYLTLRVLPSAIRPQISLAYLLARATDTIADTDLVPLESRLEALRLLRERILGNSKVPVNLGELTRHQSAPAERVLLERCEEAVHILETTPPEDRQRIRDVLSIITSGQELDLTRFAGADSRHVMALDTDSELDDYTWRVAGCVGEFWTHICRARLFPGAPLDDSSLLANGIRFGKGLQLVNILRDIPRDLANGRCYLPRQALAKAGLKPQDLFTASNETALRPLYNGYLDQAQAHLQAGWEYTNALPRGQVRLRLACAWPILIGAKTLAKLRRMAILDTSRRIKVSRAEVRNIMARTLLFYCRQRAWREQFAHETNSLK